MGSRRLPLADGSAADWPMAMGQEATGHERDHCMQAVENGRVCDIPFRTTDHVAIPASLRGWFVCATVANCAVPVTLSERKDLICLSSLSPPDRRFAPP